MVARGFEASLRGGGVGAVPSADHGRRRVAAHKAILCGPARRGPEASASLAALIAPRTRPKPRARLAGTGFVIQRLQLLGRRDAREPRFLHPALGNEGGELWLQCWLQRGRWRRTLGGLRFDECVSGRDTSSDDAEQGVDGWPVKSRHRMVQHELRTSGASCQTDPRAKPARGVGSRRF